CGNVLGSSGSVLHEFLRQIRQKKNLVITHPEVTRFFVRPDGIARHLLNAVATDIAHDVAVAEMGTPVKIIDLAQSLLRILKLEGVVAVTNHRLLPGEKLHEGRDDAGQEKHVGDGASLRCFESLESTSLRYIQAAKAFTADLVTAPASEIRPLLETFLNRKDK